MTEKLRGNHGHAGGAETAQVSINLPQGGEAEREER